jgi:tRNA pseudouridine55 synthase
VTRARASQFHGVLLLDKPAGCTSNAALQRVRHRLGRPKAGHTGTLDPLATGLLPVCIGEATKFSQSLLSAEKTYDAHVRFGFRSTTGDAEGELQAVEDPPQFGSEQLESAIASLTGNVEQVPPMFSAIKVGGTPLYAHARAGREVDRAARVVHISRVDVLERAPDSVRLSITCSKGTYIRTLAEDLGSLLGCGGYLLGLRRTAVGPFRISQAVALSEIEREAPDDTARKLLPVDALLWNLPKVQLDAAASSRLLDGLLVEVSPGRGPGPVRVYGPDLRFLGLGKIAQPGILVPQRMMSRVAEPPVNP